MSKNDIEQAEAEVVPSSSSGKAKLSLVKLLLEIKLSFSSEFRLFLRGWVGVWVGVENEINAISPFN